MDPDLWREVRWRVALQLMLWGMKAAPNGDPKGDLIDRHLSWIERWRPSRRRLSPAETE